MSSIPARVVARLCHAVAVAVTLATLTILTLSFSTSAATPPAPPLHVGQGIFTTNITNVRATADGTLLGTQPKNALGTITAGPTFVSADSAWWVKVTFGAGPSGWVGADMLIDGVPLPHTVNIGTSNSLTSLLLDPDANIDIAYASGMDAQTNTLYSFRESTNQGLSFSAPSLLPVTANFNFMASPQPQPFQMAAERNGALDVVFVCPTFQCKPPASWGVPGVVMIRSLDHGATWSAPILLGIIPTNLLHQGSQSPVIAACGAGVTVAWLDDGVGYNATGRNPNPEAFNPDLFIVNVVNGVPGAPMNVTDSPMVEASPQLIVNPQGTVYLTWTSTPTTINSSGPTSLLFASIPNCGAVAQ
jgi:hypothetical protein